MLDPSQILTLVQATKGAVDIFDRIGGQIKAFITKRPKEEMGGDDRWRYKIKPVGDKIEVTSDSRTVQTITADELQNLDSNSLTLIQTLEKRMQRHFRVWAKVYEKKDASQDPMANALVDEQLDELISKMREDLLKILEYLQQIGLHLDDHYMHIRCLVEEHA